MNINQIINLVALVTLFEMMVTIGMGAALAEVARVAADRRLLVRAFVANYFLVPLATIGLLFLFRASPLVAAGFLVIAVCPGAPYAPPFTALAKGNIPTAIGLMVILAGSSALAAPPLLRLLLPIVARDAPVDINAAKMVVMLAIGQLLPLFIGLLLRQRRPELALRLMSPAVKLSKVLNLLLLVVILAAQYRMLAAIRPIGYLGMIMLLVATLASGRVMGGRNPAERKTMTIVTAVRNAGVGLAIATASFPGTPAVTAATAYALVQTVAVGMIAVAWGRRGASEGAEQPAQPAVQ